MNPFRFILFVCLPFLIFPVVAKAVVGEGSPLEIDKKVGEIHVLDTLTVDLDMNQEVCINDSILLKCENLDKDVFAYEWIDSVSGVVISRNSTVWVSPKTTTVYKLNVYYFSGELIVNGNFEDSKRELAKGITDYKWGANSWNHRELWDEGTYRIGASPSDYHPNFYDLKDHSGKGNMMIVNGAPYGNVKVWGTKVPVTKGFKYAFSTWGITVCLSHPAEFHFTINGKQLGTDFTLKDGSNREVKWEQFYEIWEADAEVADISLVNLNTATGGNDFAIDDISFATMRMETGTVKVEVLPHIVVGSLKDQVVCEGESKKITIETYGSDITYQWGKHGGAILSDSSTLMLSDIAKNNQGSYFCIVDGKCKPSLTETFELKVNDTLKIRSVRDSTLSVCEDTKVEMSVKATGGSVLYKWDGPGKTGWIGGTEATYRTSAVAKAADGRYHCAVSNECGVDTLYRTLRVIDKIKLEMVSRDTVVCTGQAVTFQVAVNNNPAVYKWTLPDGSMAAGQMVQAGHAGSYYYQVSGCGVVEGHVKLAYFQPMMKVRVWGDTVVCKDGTVVLSSEITGGEGLKYLWEGPDAFRASTASVVIGPVTVVKAGKYKLTVTDTCGTVFSDSLQLRVAKDFTTGSGLTEQPVCQGSPTELKAVVTGEKLSWQWSKGSTVWQQKEQTLHFDKVTSSDSGIYHCRVSSLCGDALLTFHLRVMEPTWVRQHTSDKYLCHGDSVDLRVEAIGESLAYQWQKGGMDIPDSTRPVLSLKNLTQSDSVLYTCIVQGTCGIVSAEIWVRVGDFIVLTSDSTLNLCEGDSYVFKIRVDPACIDSYQYRWMLGNDTVSKSEALILSDVKNSQQYCCYVESYCGNDTIDLDVKVLLDPKITKITPEVWLSAGKSHRIEVVATGDSLSYYWVKDRGSDRLNDSPAIDFPSLSLSDAGEYDVMVSNRCSKQYGFSQLNVWKKTVITTEDQDVKVCVGSSAHFTVEATGELDIEYNWYHKGVPIGEKTPEYRIPMVETDDAGEYMCIAEGKGDADTCYIRLEVNGLPGVKLEGAMDVCTYEQGTPYEVVGDVGWSYTWTVSEGTLTAGTITDRQITIDWNEAGSGRIHLKAEVPETGCSSELDSVVKIHPRLELTLDLPEEVGHCVDKLDLSSKGTPAGGEFWVNGRQTALLEFTNKEIPYQVEYRYKDAYGCETQIQKTVKLFSKPQIKTPAKIEIGACHPFTIRSVEATMGAIGWTPASNLNRTDTLHPVFTPGGTTTYRVKLTDKYGCMDSAPVQIVVIPLPAVNLSEDKKQGVCQELTLTAEVHSAALASVEWSPLAELLVSADRKSAEVVDRKAGKQKYTTLATDSHGCQALDSVWVTWVSKPDLGGEKVVCYPDSIRVDASSYLSFHWRDASPEKVRTLKEIGEYWLEVTDEYGCTDHAFYIIRPQPDLILQVEDTVAYCREELRLDMATPAGGSYFVNGVENKNGLLVLSDKTIAYKLEYHYTDTLTGCSNVALDTVVLARPPSIGLPEEIVTGACRPVYLQVDSASEGQVEWSPATGLSSVTELRPLFTPGTTTRYKVVLTDQYNCQAEDTVWVRIVVPVLEVARDTSLGLCNERVIPWRVVSGTLDTLTWSPDDHLNIRADNSVELLYREPGRYHFELTATDQYGCVTSVPVEVSLYGLPDLGADREGCADDTLEVDCSAYADFSWGDGNREAVRTIRETGAYVLEVTDRFGCKDTASYTLYVRPELTFDLPPRVGYCVDSIRIDRALPVGGTYSVNGVGSEVVAFADKTIPYVVAYRYTDTVTRCESVAERVIQVAVMPEIHLPDSVGVGRCRPMALPVVKATAGGVKWSPADYLSGDEVLHPVFTAGESGVYRVLLTDEYDCTAGDSIRVRVFELPVVQVMDDTLLGSCNDLTLTLAYSTDVLKGVVWSPSADLRVKDDYSAELLKKKAGEHLFVATVTDIFDCTASDSVRVTIDELPELGVDKETCFRDSIVVDCTPFRSFEWSDNYQGAFRVLREVGDYTLEVTDVYGCTDDISYSIHPLPVTGVVDTFIFEKQTMEFVLNLDNRYAPYTIRWQDGNGSEVYAVQEEGLYSVMVSDNIGCTTRDTAYLEVKRMYIAAPDAFMPGTSGENSKFYLKEVNFIGDFKMYVYDRWGELVFQSNEIGFNGGWDGAFKGMECLAGAYVWVAYNNGKVVGKGTVVLVK